MSGTTDAGAEAAMRDFIRDGLADGSIWEARIGKGADAMTIRASDALRDILAERKRQDAKWGEQNHDPFLYLTILGEEYGETCKAALEARFTNEPIGSLESIGRLYDLRMEAVQTAAVAMAIVECIDRKKWRWSTP
jgi:hypothetical protein